jgi:hypothetical protein
MYRLIELDDVRHLTPEDLMGGPILLLAPLMLLIALAVAVLAAVATPRRGGPVGSPAPTASVPLGSPAAIRARRHMNVATGWAWAAFAAATALAFLLLSRVAGDTTGLVATLAPAAIGVVFLAVHLLGELTWPRPEGSVRRAALHPRSARRVLGTLLVAWTGALALVLVVLLLVGGLTAGTSGRSIEWTSPDGLRVSSASPYPGWSLAIPLLVATAVVVVLTALVLRLVVARAAVADTHELDDLALRRTSAARVLAGSQLVLGLTSAGVLLLVSSTWHSLVATVELNGADATRLPSQGLSAAGILLAFAIGLASSVVAVVALARSTLPDPPPVDGPAEVARTSAVRDGVDPR